MTINDKNLSLVSIFGPNSDQQQFYEEVFDNVRKISNAYCILCGDYNLVIDPQHDYCNYKNNKNARNTMIEYMHEYCLVDIFRELFPSKRRYTWRRTRSIQQARLYYFLISEGMQQFVEQHSIDASFQSDHSITTLKLKFDDFKHGKGLWKHNNSLLKDLKYLEAINEVIDKIKMQYALLVYNIDNIKNIPDNEIQFTMNDQLFL